MIRKKKMKTKTKKKQEKKQEKLIINITLRNCHNYEVIDDPLKLFPIT